MTHVLLVEDSQTQADQIFAMLSPLGMQVTIVHDGIEGLNKITELLPDIVILDVELPGMDGFQICRRLRRDPQTAQIPIIMLTEKSHPKAVKAGVEAGADDYISKDIFAAEHLLNTLEHFKLSE